MNSINKKFKVSLFGASHDKIIGAIIDGCPSGIALSEQLFEDDLSRRKARKTGTTHRQEKDIPEIVSGVYNNFSTGAPITIIFKNEQINSDDYQFINEFWRPGHADFVAEKKYNGFADLRGGGHFSGRITVALTACGVIAKQIINPITIHAQLIEAGGNTSIEQNVEKAIKQDDSIGGIVSCNITNVPIGLGEPFFDSIESVISHAVFSIPGIKGIAFGAGFDVAKMKGSENNDLIIDQQGHTKTNNSGGINGGISNGNDIYFTVAVKPTASIKAPQQTFNHLTQTIDTLQIQGRHDACFALRVPPIIEAASAIALADLWLRKT